MLISVCKQQASHPPASFFAHGMPSTSPHTPTSPVARIGRWLLRLYAPMAMLIQRKLLARTP